MHAHTHARAQAHTYAHTYTCKRARMRAHAHAHPHKRHGRQMDPEKRGVSNFQEFVHMRLNSEIHQAGSGWVWLPCVIVGYE